jgi:hypothetical protein
MRGRLTNRRLGSLVDAQCDVSGADGQCTPFTSIARKSYSDPIFSHLEFHHTPKHASWLNMAEIEIGVLNGQCLDRRLDNVEWLRSEVSAWEERRNKQQVKIHWSFTIAVARHKLKKLYPIIENSNPPT